jgi:PAS domain S-box-containing protein
MGDIMKDDNKTKKQLIHELTELRSQKAALEKSESAEKYRSLVENIRDVIYELDSQGVVLYISPAIRDMLGYDSTEIVGKNFIELAHKEDQSNLAEWFSELRKGKESPSEYRVSNKSGEIRWARTNTRPTMEDGLFKGARGILIDVTEQRRVEKALQESEERYRELIDFLPISIFEVDTAGSIISFNRTALDVLGYDEEDYKKGMSSLQFFAPEERQRVGENMVKVIQGTSTPGQEFTFLRKDGGMFPGLIYASPNIQQNKTVGIRGVIIDITERNRAEKELQALSSRNEAILASIPDIIMEVDNNKIYTWANHAGIEFFGKGVIGKEAAFYFVGEQETYDIVSPLFMGRDDVIYVESWQRRQDGEKRLLAWWCLVLKDAEGNISGALSTARDITDYRCAEKKLSESEKKYRELYDFLPIPVYEMDFEANITSANRAIYETFRGTEEDLMKGFKGWQLLSPEDIDKSIKNIEHLLKGEKIGGTEYTLMRLDGSVFPAIIVSSVIYSNEKPVGLRGAIIDITQRKQAEEDLRRMNTFLDSVVENIPNMIFLKDAGNLRFVRFNRAGEDLLGYSRNDLLGKNDYDFFPKDQADFFTKKDREVLYGKEVVDIPEESLQTRNKGERTMHTKKVPLLDVNGKPEYLLGISEDITERKQAEKQLQDTLESLRKAVGTTIQVISSTVEARDPYTSGHQTRSADLARAIAMEMGLPQDKIDAIRMAGSIHDIGKISIPAEILSKPTKLSEIEFSLIKEHARKGYEMLKDVESPWLLAEIVYQHHERMDGSGYPRNLKGEEICMEARILAVADVVEAMASHRPYRPGLGIDAALKEIEKNRGICYDDAVADACLRLFREKGFNLEGS